MFPRTSGLKETLGAALGTAMAPLFGIGSALRNARFFHPHGICFHATVKPVKTLRPHYAPLAKRLSGDALVRMSAGLWRTERRYLPDLLGFSIRFKAWPPLEIPTDDAQDLLTATARSIWTLALDSLKTRQGNFLENEYYGMAPFEIDGKGDIQIRIVPTARVSQGADRYEKIRNAVEHGGVDLRMEILDPSSASDWQPIVQIHLQQAVEIDETRLQFWPFRTGQGIKPQGFVQYLRPAPYIASRFARSKVNSEDIAKLEEKAEKTIPPTAKPASIVELGTETPKAQRLRKARATRRAQEPTL